MVLLLGSEDTGTRKVWVMTGEKGNAILVGNELFGRLYNNNTFQKEHQLGLTDKSNAEIVKFIFREQISAGSDTAEYLDELGRFVVPICDAGYDFVMTDPGRKKRFIKMWKRDIALNRFVLGASVGSVSVSTAYLIGTYRQYLGGVVGGFVLSSMRKFNAVYHYSVQLVCEEDASHNAWFELNGNGCEDPLCVINGENFTARHIYPVSNLETSYVPTNCGHTYKSNDDIEEFNIGYLQKNKKYNTVTNNCLKYALELEAFLKDKNYTYEQSI